MGSAFYLFSLVGVAVYNHNQTLHCAWETSKCRLINTTGVYLRKRWWAHNLYLVNIDFALFFILLMRSGGLIYHKTYRGLNICTWCFFNLSFATVSLEPSVNNKQFTMFFIGIPVKYNTNWILIHWGRVTHICVRNLTIIGSDNGLSPLGGRLLSEPMLGYC